MKNSKLYNNLLLLIVIFCVIFSLQVIFNLEGALILLLLIYCITAALIPKWIKDEEIKFKYKIILCSIVFLLSNLTIFYGYGFNRIKDYLLWFFIVLIASIIVNLIYKAIKNHKKSK